MSFYGQEFFGGDFHGYNHQEPYVGVSVFFGGEFFDSGFFQAVGEHAEVVKTGGKGDNKKRKSIYKPTGLLEGRKTVEQRVQATREIHREVLRVPPKPIPVALMSIAQIEAEIGDRLRASSMKEEEEVILMLLAAAVAG